MVKKKSVRKKVSRSRSVKRSSDKESVIGFYKSSWNYLKESKSYIFFVIGLFFVFALIGFFVPASPEVDKLILEMINEIVSKTEGMSQAGLISYIFFNNLWSSFSGLFFGIFLGLVPLGGSVLNGYVVGFVSERVVGVEGLSVLWKLVPHGIFELPAIFISFGLGLKLGSFIFRKEKLESLRYYLWNSVLVFVLIVLPLLVVAAIIEGTLIFIGS